MSYQKMIHGAEPKQVVSRVRRTCSPGEAVLLWSRGTNSLPLRCLAALFGRTGSSCLWTAVSSSSLGCPPWPEDVGAMGKRRDGERERERETRQSDERGSVAFASRRMYHRGQNQEGGVRPTRTLSKATLITSATTTTTTTTIININHNDRPHHQNNGNMATMSQHHKHTTTTTTTTTTAASHTHHVVRSGPGPTPNPAPKPPGGGMRPLVNRGRCAESRRYYRPEPRVYRVAHGARDGVLAGGGSGLFPRRWTLCRM